jgi:hypothetical protein
MTTRPEALNRLSGAVQRQIADSWQDVGLETILA